MAERVTGAPALYGGHGAYLSERGTLVASLAGGMDLREGLRRVKRSLSSPSSSSSSDGEPDLNESPQEYERHVLEQIDKLKNPEPSRLRAALDRVQGPIVNAAASALNNRAGRVPARGVQWLMKTLDESASRTVWSRAIYSEFAKAGFAVTDGNDIHRLELKDVDRVIDGLDAKSEWLAFATGASAGTLGIMGSALDIPGLVGIALRSLTEYATYYGFDPATDDEKAFVLMVLATASATTLEERQAALKELSRMSVLLSSGDSRTRSGRLLSMRMIARVGATLGGRLVRDQSVQSVPLMGAAVGAATNTWFIRNVAQVGRQIYRERFLIAKHGPEVAVPVGN